ncbi:MAG: tetratricopeptide repeat protein [bacterium]
MNANIIDVSVQNFQDEVIEKSKQVPVLLEFYAEGTEPSQALTPLLRKLADEYQGKFILARVDIQQNQQIVQQLGVRTLPTLKVIFQGQMAQDLEGPQDEARLRQILDQLTMSPIEQIQAQIKILLDQGDRASAITMLQQAVGKEPNNHGLHVELADLLIMESRSDEARQILAGLPAETPGIVKPQNRLEFIDKSADLPDIDSIEARLAEDPDDLGARYNLAIRLVVDDQIEAALEELLYILKKDRIFEDELARKTMIQVFDLLGKGDPVATAYRRKMFSFLH